MVKKTLNSFAAELKTAIPTLTVVAMKPYVPDPANPEGAFTENGIPILVDLMLFAGADIDIEDALGEEPAMNAEDMIASMTFAIDAYCTGGNEATVIPIDLDEYRDEKGRIDWTKTYTIID